MSYEYYNQHALEFFEGTINADVSVLVNKFLSYLKPGSTILDAGCGIGRDTKTFLDAGFKVVAFDASSEMVKISSEYTGQETLLMKFNEMDFDNQFDSIWASASLLHVKKVDMDSIFTKLHKALKENGILYVSYKLKDQDYSKDNRDFSCYTETGFTEFIEQYHLFKIIDLWTSTDVRVDRSDEEWLNCLLMKY